jgi:hypothetical protein
MSDRLVGLPDLEMRLRRLAAWMPWVASAVLCGYSEGRPDGHPDGGHYPERVSSLTLRQLCQAHQGRGYPWAQTDRSVAATPIG